MDLDPDLDLCPDRLDLGPDAARGGEGGGHRARAIRGEHTVLPQGNRRKSTGKMTVSIGFLETGKKA